MGGAAGALLRFFWGEFFPASGTGFPWAVFTENITGAFILGWLLAVFIRRLGKHRYIRSFFGTGLVGSFTTFSGITTDLVIFTNSGSYLLLILYTSVSILAGLIAAWAGLTVGRIKRRFIL